MSEQRLREVAPGQDARRGRLCAMCGSIFKLQLAHTSPDGAETWLCKNTQACAARMAKRLLVKADWPCHHADKTELVMTRPCTDLSWYEWHMARGEVGKAARHSARPEAATEPGGGPALRAARAEPSGPSGVRQRT